MNPLGLPIPANSLAHSTKGTPSPALRPAPTSWKQTWFQYYFNPLTGVLFTFPSRYLFTIDLAMYLALEGDPPSFPADFTCPLVLRYRTKQSIAFRVPGFHRLWPSFPGSFHYATDFLLFVISPYGPTTPTSKGRFGLFRFRSPLLTELQLFSFPLATEMFQFASLPSLRIRTAGYPTSGWVTPFGHPRIKALLPAPRGVSSAHTSFIGIASQGIHHVLVTYLSPS